MHECRIRLQVKSDNKLYRVNSDNVMTQLTVGRSIYQDTTWKSYLITVNTHYTHSQRISYL